MYAATWTFARSWCPALSVLFRGGWLILIPHEDKVDVISPINILFWEGGGFWSLMKIKLMFLARSAYWSWGVADFVPSWRSCWCNYPIQHIGHRGWRVVCPFSKLVIGGGGFWSLMMIRWYCFLMTITVFEVSFTCHCGLIFSLGLAWIRNFPATQNCLCFVTMMSLGER